MKLHLTHTAGRNIIRSHAPGRVVIDECTYTRSLVVTPGHILDAWRPQTFADLAEVDFEELGRLRPQIVLLGTGTRLRFPDPRLTRGLSRAGIGIEVMDTGAACRTYNILVGEDREVVAGLLLAD